MKDRTTFPFTETMEKYHGEIDRMLYAAEIECHAMNGKECYMLRSVKCPFRKRNEVLADACLIPLIRNLVGEKYHSGFAGILEDSFR